MIDIKKIDAGQDVVVMLNNKPETVKVRAVNILKRWENNQKTEIVEIFVEGVERKVAPEELFNSVQDCVNSFLPENKSAGK